jgi:ketosteroid isomerase-like protein
MIQAERTGRKQERRIMCKEDDNKAIVGRWFKDFWNTPPDLTVVDELATPDVLLQYSPDTPRRGRDAVRAFRASLRDAFPDLAIAGASLIADRDMVVVRWTASARTPAQPSTTSRSDPFRRRRAAPFG